MLPELTDLKYKSDQHIINFQGLNRLPVRNDGEMLDMLNLTSDYSPYLATRKQREIYKNIADISYIGSHGDNFYYIKGTNFYINDTQKGTVTAGEKSVAVINDYVVIFPDKKYYDIVNDEWKEMEVKKTSTSCHFTSNQITIGGFSPKGIFEVGDSIVITGASAKNNKTFIIKSFPYDNVIEVAANTFEAQSTNNVSFERELPDLEFVVEHENRLWGCKGNEIFASKLGSCSNFNSFQGVSSDSYAAEVGTPGNFTAVINYNNNLLFFKEHCIHKIFGNKPSNYQIITQHTEGVASGNHKSLAIAGGILYYKTNKHIVAYNGTTPEIISTKLGDKVYTRTVSGTDGYKIYFSMDDELLVFDTLRNVWHKEDTEKFNGFIYHKGDLIGNTGKALYKMVGENSDNISFMALFGPFNEKGYYNDQQRVKKGYSKLNIEIELEINSQCKLSINYDGGPYKELATYTGNKKYHRIIIQPQRCNEFIIKLEGAGGCKIASITRAYRTRGDV